MLSPSPIPLYYQIANVLRHRILDGSYRPGERIGTEKELCEDFGVSRITVVKALGELEREKLIVRQRSLGTFVASHVLQRASMTFTGYLEDLSAQVLQFGSREVDLDRQPAPAEVAAALGLEEGETVVRIERVRMMGGIPLSHTVDYLPLSVGGDFTVEDLRHTAVIHLLEWKLGIRLEEALQTIRAVAATRELAEKLDICEGGPLLQVQRTIYGGGRPLEYVTIHYHPDRYEYTARLTRIARSGG